MQIRQIIGALEDFAPLALQDSYDNAGLQIGLTKDAEISGVLLCLDVTEDVIDEAIGLGCNMIVSHHPLLFSSIKSITGCNYIERCVIKAIKHDITIYAAHTNLDSARGGVNYKIAEKLRLENIGWLKPKEGTNAGEGIIGTLHRPLQKAEFLELVKKTFGTGSLRYNNWHGEKINRIAICGGAGNYLIPTAVKAECDAFITGEIGYHRFFGYEAEILLMELGHYESEKYTLEILHDIIHSAAPDIPIYETKSKTNPINYI